MTRLKTYAVAERSTVAAIDELSRLLAADAPDPELSFVFYDCRHDDEQLHAFLGARFPNARLIGSTSSGGVMTERGFCGDYAIGLLCIEDPHGDYGVAAAALGDDPAATAERLLCEALARCQCVGELPELIWIYQAPGQEEQVLEGLRRVVGDRCPIVGGSSADNDVSGGWRELGPDGPLTEGLVVGVLFPSTDVGCAFQGGYEPTGEFGIVTGIGCEASSDTGVGRTAAGREILSIDDRPAAEVYNEWIGGRIQSTLDAGGGAILADTTMCPLATDAGMSDGVSNYVLIHPESVTADGALKTFCRLDQGARVFAMRGDPQQLVDRAGRVAERARNHLGPDAGLAGALVVYCGGCKLAVGDDIHDVARAIDASLAGAPYLCCFTFGEQGRMLDRNIHGNLMISATTFEAPNESS